MTDKASEEKRDAMLESILDKSRSAKKLTDAELAILDVYLLNADADSDLRAIKDDLLQQLVDADEARAAARETAQKHRNAVEKRMRELRQASEKHRAQNAIQVAQTLVEMGVLNRDFTYKIDAALFNAVVREYLNSDAAPASAPAPAPAPRPAPITPPAAPAN